MDKFRSNFKLRRLLGAATLIIVISSVQQVSGGEANYAAVIARGESWSEKFCMAYNPKFHSLPISFDDSDWVTLVDFTSKPDSRDLCALPSVLPVLEASAIAVLRGNCSFTDKARNAQHMGAVAVVIVANELIVPNASQTPEFNEINITIGVVLQDDFAKLVSTNGTLRVKMYSPSSLRADYSILLLAFLAIFTLTVGSYWSGVVRYQISLHRNGLTLPGSSEYNTAKKEDVGSVPLTAVTVIFCVAIMIGVLLGLYFFYEYLVYQFIVIFGLSAGYALSDCIMSIFLLFPPVLACRLPENRVPGFRDRPEIKSFIITGLCLGVGIWWIIERHSSYAWILQDILGVALCLHLLKQIRLSSFKVCFVLLVAIFVYDVFFVFITPLFTKNGRSIMIEVATGGGNKNSEQSAIALSKDSPTSMLPLLMISPRLGDSDSAVCGVQYSMLGFGDILVPGLLVSFCHGFDLMAHTSRIYYISTCIAYSVGLVITWVALLLMQTGQPALLYIVPCLLLTVAIIGAVRRELPALWSGAPITQHNEPETDMRDRTQPSEDDNEVDTDSSKEFSRILP